MPFKSDALLLDINAAQFVADALRSGSICLLLTSPKARRSIVSDLKRRVPSFDTPLQAGMLIASEYAESGGAQLKYFERELGLAVKAGARIPYVVGDLSGGGPERATFPRLMDYEYEYEHRIVRRFPVVTLCQYDARRLSGLEVLATLQAHPDALRYAGSAPPT